ncbi:MAG: DUF4838 domain-containing protein [Kiritimatiellae bacterium]|nr:DUF4838 domain-containing protein [Kiritimatiellia bacterium]
MHSANLCKTFLTSAALVFALSGAALAARPVQKTAGEPCDPPALTNKPYVVTGELVSHRVPMTGWKLTPPPGETNAVPGVTVVETNAVVRGVEMPALRLEFTKGSFRRFPLIEIPFALNANEDNILSFVGKIEYPKEHADYVIGDSPQLITGWFAATYRRYWDDFGVSVFDGTFPWARHGVMTTNFKRHDYPETRGEDGFADFVWDMRWEEGSSYKSFFREHGESIQLLYDNRKIGDDDKVVVTIADMKVTRGAHFKFDDPDRYAAWTNFVANYEPDYSDSSKYLEPLKSGKAVRLAKGGEACVEIVVALGDDLAIANWLPTNKLDMLARNAQGFEWDVARLAARELARWLHELTGGTFEVVTEPTAAKNAKIFLGAPFAKGRFDADLAALASATATDGFAIREKGGNLYIFGVRPAGTLYGVYAFIENNSDLIWAMADEKEGTVFTANPDLVATWTDAREIPVFRVRGWQGGPTVWRRRNRINFGGRCPQGEGFFCVEGGHLLCPQYYDTCVGLRQWNAMITGGDTKRPHEKARPERWNEYRVTACLRDPEFFKHAIDTVPQVRNIMYSMQTGVCVFGTDDNLGWCECPKCTAPIKLPDGSLLTPEKDVAAFYGAWFYDYLNRLDDAIQKVRPGFVTSTFAYFMAADYPPIPVNKTIVPWICTYPRRAQNEPIFAPVNQNWWRIYQAWANHSKDCLLYDYYGLGFILNPKAEVHKFDLLAQRDIGFLANSAEGFGANEYMGVADERWCMSRLDWNPDLDVEQLHRYFTRRVYREAAPWVDKFRGTIRKAWLQHANRPVEFCENREVITVVTDLGLEKELLGYLDQAVKAAVHPASKVLVEKMRGDFRYYLTEKEKLDFPSKSAVAAKPKPAPAAKNPKLALVPAKEIATNGLEAAVAKFEALSADRLIADGEWNTFLSAQVLPAMVAADPSFGPTEAVAFLRRHLRDPWADANGRSMLMNGYFGPKAIRPIAEAFTRRGDIIAAADVYAAWADWDGDILPAGLRAIRLSGLIDYVRGVRASANSAIVRDRAILEKNPSDSVVARRLSDSYLNIASSIDAERKYAAQWRSVLQRATREGGNAAQRGDAMWRLAREDWGRMGVPARVKAVDAILQDSFMPNSLREKVATFLPEAYAGKDGKTDWEKVEAHFLAAAGKEDWSDLRRRTYHGDANDCQLNALCAIVKKEADAGEGERAKAFLEKGAELLGYTEGKTHKDEPACSEKGWNTRLAKLNAARAALAPAEAAPAK